MGPLAFTVELGVQINKFHKIKYNCLYNDLYLKDFSFPLKKLDQDLVLLASQDFVMPL